MSLGASKSKSTQRSSINPFSQIVARLLLGKVLGGDAYNTQGIGSLHGGDPGNAAPETPYTEVLQRPDDMGKAQAMRDALTDRFANYGGN